MNSKQANFFIIGHRGAAGDFFENSLAGFQHATEIGIDAIELDIHEHGDKLWVIHDPELERLTTGIGLLAEADDLSMLHLKNGDPIPTLQQVLDMLWGKISINIEIKTIIDPGHLLDVLARYPASEKQPGMPPVLISSFNHRLLLKLRELDCPWPVAPISYGIPAAIDDLLEQLQPWSWHFDDEYIDFDLVDELRQRSIRSLVYTVNTTRRARQLRERGIDGIFTDYPGAFALDR